MDDIKSGFDVFYLSANLMNPDGTPVPDGVYDMNLAIFVEPQGGQPMWTQWMEAVKVSQGSFQVPLDRKAVPWDQLPQGVAYLEVQVGKEVAQTRQKLDFNNFDSKSSPTVDPPVLNADGVFSFAAGLVPQPLPPMIVDKPVTASVVGRLYVGEAPWGIDASDGYVYIATLHNQFHAIDVRDPAQPRIVASLNLAHPVAGAIRLVKSGNYVYVLLNNNLGGTNSGLMVLNVSEPTQPALVGNWRYDRMVHRVTVSGDRAVVSPATADLQVITLEKGLPVHTSQAVLTWGFAGVDIAGSHAYAVTSGNQNDPSDSGRSYLHVIDLMNSKQPTVVARVSLRVQEPLLLRVGDGYAYVTGRRNVGQVIDVSKPTQPIVVADWSVVNIPSSLWRVEHSLICIDEEADFFQILDVSNPSQPISYDLDFGPGDPGGGHLYGVVSNGYAYVVSASTGILRIISISM